MGFIKLEQLLDRNLKRAGLRNRVSAAQTVDRFSQVLAKRLGEAVAAKAQPLYVKDGTLTVACLTSAVAQEIKLRERQLIQELEDDSVQRIRYVT